ncbi:MAG: hypothetical protein AAGF89_08510 [Bacteroidota bacterium]
MTINDLKIDIITAVNQLSDISVLKEIKRSISSNAFGKSNSTSVWKNADVEIREGVSFDQLLKEQGYKKITFSEFTSNSLSNDWEVSLDTLLSNSN